MATKTNQPASESAGTKFTGPFVPEPQKFWGRALSEIEVPNNAALKLTVNQHIAGEQRIITVQESLPMNAYEAQKLHGARKQEHIEKLAAGEISLDTPFQESVADVVAECYNRRDSLMAVLVRKIAITRPFAKQLIESYLEPINVAREQMQDAERAAAEKWGTPFTPSDPLRVLASLERMLEHAAGSILSHPDCNPTRSYLQQILPPGVID